MLESTCKLLAAVHDGLHQYICVEQASQAADVAQAPGIDRAMIDLSPPPLPPPPPSPCPPRPPPPRPPPPHMWAALVAHAGHAYPASATVNWQAIVALLAGCAIAFLLVRWLEACCKPKSPPPLTKVEQWRIDHLTHGLSNMFGQPAHVFAEPSPHHRLEPRLVAAKRALPPLYDMSPWWGSPDPRSPSHFLLPVSQRESPVFGAPRARGVSIPSWTVSIPGGQSPSEPKLTPKRSAMVAGMLHKMVTALTPRLTPRSTEASALSAAAAPSKTPRSARADECAR